MFVWAHRGASGVAPENTLRAFEQAIEAGADGIEFDVHMVEQTPIVIHDAWLQKTTNGLGLVRQATLAQIQALDAGDGQTVPTVRETLAMIRGRCQVNLELKAANCAMVVAAEVRYAIEQGWFGPEQIIVSSFNHKQLHIFAKQMPNIRVGALTANLPVDNAAFALDLNAWSLHCNRDFVDQALVDDAHEKGLKVYVYTVNHIEDIDYMVSLRVDGIFTDYPARAIQYLQVKTNSC
ncbi:glycerophosphoryl diester phosphodiesterase family protein [Catenovulum agarivorans DS-2]|uniref:Glycerophosphoryl diester phosphodiesterase family protein n=1 Tax=Catenovulum agarivorans DS-2 TaxID=1328313 RepID=W7QAB7_9ALTE|nr:glycerophosphodiester phosphodiesterase family protein [Catenovulum agarivorans]EWH09744.1 glycerophosphoryl diester phosphodiesterase family protein [Catenovulum agarivorans DS-2]